MLVNRAISQEGQKENDAGVLIGRNGACSSSKVEQRPVIRIQHLFLQVVQEGLLCPMLHPLTRGLCSSRQQSRPFL